MAALKQPSDVAKIPFAKSTLPNALIVFLLSLIVASTVANAREALDRPNVIVIFLERSRSTPTGGLRDHGEDFAPPGGLYSSGEGLSPTGGL